MRYLLIQNIRELFSLYMLLLGFEDQIRVLQWAYDFVNEEASVT